MVLEEFISDAIVQIASGIIKAQKICAEKEYDVLVNPNVIQGQEGNLSIPNNPKQIHIQRQVQIVDMNVAVTVQNAIEGGLKGNLGIHVLGIGSRVNGKSDTIHESRIHFSIPVCFPTTEVKTVKNKDKYSEIEY